MIWLYRVFYFFLFLLAKTLSPFHAKLKLGFQLRQSEGWQKLPKMNNPIWIHCASGEFEYAKPVIREIKKRNPQTQILVTYFSPSVRKSLKENQEIDFFCPMPLDFKSQWLGFIEKIKPCCLLISRTDLWPMMLTVSKQKGIPHVLFSTTITRSSNRLSGIGKSLYRKLFLGFSNVFCVSQEDEILLKELDSGIKTEVTGDTRFDQVIHRQVHGKVIHPKLQSAHFVIGSSWSEDETVLLESLEEICKRHPEFKVILAPHEPTMVHLQSLQSQLEQKNLSWQKYSQFNGWQSQVLLIDHVGILADLYKLAPLAFVGGSFKKTVHSVMEPLASGCLTLVGPLHENNREALAFRQKSAGSDRTAVEVCNNSEELSRKIESFLKLTDSEKQQISRQIIQLVDEQSGTSPRVADWALQHV